jgi:hypothetical protein
LDSFFFLEASVDSEWEEESQDVWFDVWFNIDDTTN